MDIKHSLKLLLIAITLSGTMVACDQIGESDTTAFQLVSFFDLRERDTFIQLTTNDQDAPRVHVQIFNVDENCNEYDFFDQYTVNDTHVYNLRDIITNDGNPSGVVLPDNAYGIVVFTAVTSDGLFIRPDSLFGNVRVLDNLGYEYRTNMLGIIDSETPSDIDDFFINFNQISGVTFSDIIGITIDNTAESEVTAADIVSINLVLDVDILDLDENIFSCRNVIFACTDQDNPLLEALLADDDDDDVLGTGSANVASFEYGINEAIPHSKGGELLCPGNNIQEGLVRLTQLGEGSDSEGHAIFVGLNNGNGRGSLDSFWFENTLFFEDDGGTL